MDRVTHFSRILLRYSVYGIAVVFGLLVGFLNFRAKSGSHHLISGDSIAGSTAYADAPGAAGCSSSTSSSCSSSGTGSNTSGGGGGGTGGGGGGGGG